MTNGDNIHAMNNRELAKFLSSLTVCVVCPAKQDNCLANADKVCVANWLKWIKGNAKNE